MSQLILYPTDTSQWHALVNEAQVLTQLRLNQDTESYLVFLLMRFAHMTDWIDSVVALDVLESKLFRAKHKIEVLCEVGDKSLLFSGLFPGVARKRHVSPRYYADMGRAAYFTVSELHTRETAPLYQQLGQQFVSLQTILHALRCEHRHSASTENPQSVWLKNNVLQ
jgi:hypothetical protein